MKTYVIGHIKPDLDSAVAAISIAKYAEINGETNVTPTLTSELNPESKYVFSKFGVDSPTVLSANDILPEDKIILVDHNEADQRLPGINQDQIVAIYDHHKVNINFVSPIELCFMPFGSVNTVAWQLFSEIKYQLDPKTAGLMLSAVLSDTVGLNSSTTTEKDKLAVTNLANIAGVSDIDGLTMEIFKAKSNISSLSDEQVVLNDYKIFDFGKKVLIGQTETVEQDALLLDRKQGLLNALEQIKLKEAVDYVFLAVTDILKINTKLLLSGVGEIELAQKAFGGTAQDHILDIGPKMSRKKDFAPAIEKALL